MVKDPGSTSVFGAFPEGTTLWVARACFLNPADILEISITGADDTLTLTVEAESLRGVLAFQDSAGLSSITIRNLGNDDSPPAAYYFDEITTARAE